MDLQWFSQKNTVTWLQRLCGNILKTGPIPKHVAFIMDGNRRFASKKSMENSQGHLKGVEKLAEVLEWCLYLGITEATVYAFSIDNFKRSKEEVDCLMELARARAKRLMEEKDELNKRGVCVRLIGNLSYLPQDIQNIIAEVVNLSKNNTRAFLNICLAYSSQDEISTAIKDVAEGVQMGLLKTSDVDQQLLQNCMYTNKSPNPDLLIRTSGEVRLSGFLAWQSSFSSLSFLKVLWPEFNIWHLYYAILSYQTTHNSRQVAVNYDNTECERIRMASDYKCAQEESHAEHDYLGENMGSVSAAKTHAYSLQRKRRVDAFLNYLYNKREAYIQALCPKML